jgi:hypothetical protein
MNHNIETLLKSKPNITLAQKRFAKLDFSRYYFFSRRRKMNYLLTNRGLIRPGRKHNYKYWIFKRWQLGIWRFAAAKKWGRRLKWMFQLIFWYYCALYLLPFFLRWQYDINPRTLTRFSPLDFCERWEHKLMTDLRLYRQLHRFMKEPGSSDPDVAMFGLTTPTGKPFRQGLIYYYFMLVVYPFASGMLDPLLYPRLFFWGLSSYIPPEYDNPLVPQNPLITMTTRDLLKFLSICQTRMYLATQADLYTDREVNSKYIVYDTFGLLEEYKLRCKRYRFNLDVMNKTYGMIIHELFRRIHSAVFYSGRQSIIPAPKYVPSIPKYELNENELMAISSLYDTDGERLYIQDHNYDDGSDVPPGSLAEETYVHKQPELQSVLVHNDETIQGEIPGLYHAFKMDQRIYGDSYTQSTLSRLRYLFRSNNQQSGSWTISPFVLARNIKNVIAGSFIGREAWTVVRELMNVIHVTTDRLTWLGPRTGLESIMGLDITTTGRDVAVLDYRRHDFYRPNYPLFFTTIQKRLYQINQIIYSMVTQFGSEISLSRDILDKFQYPIMNLNSDVDEITHFLSQPELPSHYTTMLQSLQEIDHSHSDYPFYDYRRVNLGILLDRRFKLKQNVLILGNIINLIQQDLDIAKATTLRDGELLSNKQFGCEWVLYDLKLQHRDLRRIVRDIEYYLNSIGDITSYPSSQSEYSSPSSQSSMKEITNGGDVFGVVANQMDYNKNRMQKYQTTAPQPPQYPLIDPNIEPCRGDKNPISKLCNLVPFQLGHIPKNILRRCGFIERGSIPLYVLGQPRSDTHHKFLPQRFRDLYYKDGTEKGYIRRNIVDKLLPEWMSEKLEI